MSHVTGYKAWSAYKDQKICIVRNGALPAIQQLLAKIYFSPLYFKAVLFVHCWESL